jgi:hypothetical protein
MNKQAAPLEQCILIRGGQTMKALSYLLLVTGLVLGAVGFPAADGQDKIAPAAAVPYSGDKPPQGLLAVDPPHISTDKAIKYDYDIVYVRAPRFAKGKDGKDVNTTTTSFTSVRRASPRARTARTYKPMSGPMRPSRKGCWPRLI